MKMMKILKVLIVVGLLVAPFLAPGASEAAYTYTFGNVQYGAIFDSSIFNGGSGAGFQVALRSLEFSDGTNTAANSFAENTRFLFSSGTWNGSNGWTNGDIRIFNTANPSELLFHATGVATSYQPYNYGNGMSGVIVTMSFASATFSQTLIDALKAKGLIIPADGWHGVASTVKMEFDAWGNLITFSFNGKSTSLPTPIPPTALLFGAGLIGLGIVRKRIK